MYSIPINFAAELVTLRDVFTHAAMKGKDDGIRDDGNLLLALCGYVSPLAIFRFVNMAPKRRTVFFYDGVERPQNRYGGSGSL